MNSACTLSRAYNITTPGQERHTPFLPPTPGLTQKPNPRAGQCLSLGRVLYYSFLIYYFVLFTVVGNWISGSRTYNVLPERDYGRKRMERAGLPGKILFTGVLQSVSLISTTIGLFYGWEGNCSIRRKLCRAEALRRRWKDNTNAHPGGSDGGGWRPVPARPPSPGSQALRAREEKQKQFQLLTVSAWGAERSRACPRRASGLHPVPRVRKHTQMSKPRAAWGAPSPGGLAALEPGPAFQPASALGTNSR